MKARQKKLDSGKKANDNPVSMATSRRVPRIACWLAPVSIVLLTFVVFFPALQNGFVNWDDDRNLLENLSYRGLDWTRLGWMFTTFHMSLYRPLTWVTLGLDYLLWGMNPFGYHLTSLLLHAVNAVLLYFIALRLLGVALSGPTVAREFPLRAAAAFSALIFAFHPLRVEPVAWASARNDVLSGLFFLWAILCYLRANAFPEGNHARMRWMTAAVIIYGMSLLSKAIGMTLPVVLLVLDIYPLRRLGSGPGKWFGSAARNVWWEKIPFLLLALGAGVIGLVTKQEAGAVVTFAQYGIVSRVSQALFGLAFYLWKTVIPLALSPLYELPLDFNPWDWRFLLSGLVILGASIGLVVARHRWPAGLASWVCYVVMLSPVLGITQSGPQIAADRYTYLSTLGWSLLAGAGLLYAWRLWAHGHSRILSATIGLAGVVVILLGALSWKQTQIWRDSETLWRYAVSVTPHSSTAHYNLAFVLQRRADLEEAIKHFRQALQIDPAYVEAYNNLGNVLARLGRTSEALKSYLEALRLEPGNPAPHYNLGNIFAAEGKLDEAANHYRQAINIQPDFQEARNNLGNVLLRQDKLPQAVEQFRQAVKLGPGRSEFRVNLANALARQGHLMEAIECFEAALKISPDSAEAHYQLAIILAAQGDRNNAISHFREAIRIRPEFADAHEGLALAFAQMGEKEKAVTHYEEALRIMKSQAKPRGAR